MRRFLLSTTRMPAFSPEGDGGGGGGGDGGGPPAYAAPDFVPEAFRGASADETLQKLAGGYTDLDGRFAGMRDKLSKMPAAPKSADEYAFDPGDKLKPFFAGDLAADPAFQSARAAAHKHGLSQEQFSGFIGEVFGPLVDGGHLPAPYDAKRETETYMKAMGLDSKEGSAALEANIAFAEGLSGQLKDVPDALKDEVKATLEALTDTAAGNVLLQALNGRLNENGIRIAGDPNVDGALSDDELKKLGGDPRIDPRNKDHADPAKRFDPALRKRYDDGMAAYGAKKYGSS